MASKTSRPRGTKSSLSAQESEILNATMEVLSYNQSESFKFCKKHNWNREKIAEEMQKELDKKENSPEESWNSVSRRTKKEDEKTTSPPGRGAPSGRGSGDRKEGSRGGRGRGDGRGRGRSEGRGGRGRPESRSAPPPASASEVTEQQHVRAHNSWDDSTQTSASTSKNATPAAPASGWGNRLFADVVKK